MKQSHVRGALRRPLSGLATVVLAAMLGAAAPAFAQDAAAPAAPAEAVTPQTVVATVGTETITEQDIAFAAEDFQQELAQVPPEQRKAFLLNVLIDMKVLAQAAKAAGMDETEVFQRRLVYLEERALRRAYLGEVIAAQVTPEAVQAAYDSYVANFVAQPEIHASQILVSSEEDAKAIKAELEAGADFATLAREKSIDPSAARNGGDLGFFGRGMMVAPFETAAFALTEPGQVSDPVRSDFGWHIIRLEEIRQSAPPPMDQVQQQIQQQVLIDAFEKSIADLKVATPVAITDPALAAAVEAQNEAP